jgi:hypothetical protein
MGILASARKALRNHIDTLENRAEARRKERANGDTQRQPTGTDFESVAQLLEETEKLKAAFERLDRELTFYKRRSSEYFALIQRLEAQREEWKGLYLRDSTGHQQAQAVLQEHVISLRQQLIGTFRLMNAQRAKNGEEPLDLSKIDLKAYPVGIADETAQQNAQDQANVSKQINAAEATAAIDREVAAPEGVGDVSHGAA